MAKPSRKQRQKRRAHDGRGRGTPSSAGQDAADQDDDDGGDDDRVENEEVDEAAEPARGSERTAASLEPVSDQGAKLPPWRRKAAKKKAAERRASGDRVVIMIFFGLAIGAGLMIWWGSQPESPKAPEDEAPSASPSASATAHPRIQIPPRRPAPRAPSSAAPKAAPSISGDFAPPVGEPGDVEPPAALK